MSSRPMFPHTVDSTMLAAFRSCPRKFELQYLRHWKPKAESVHLVAGGAFAKGIEVARQAFWERGIERDTAYALGLEALIHAYGDFECPPDSAKSLERTLGALEYYFSQYPFGDDGMEPLTLPNGKRTIEFSFAEPLPFPHPVTGDPVLYTGRSDMIAAFAGSCYVVDEKTTSSLGASWARQWEMRSQFTGYSWAARNHGFDVAGTIVRGVSILKTKYDTLQVPTYRAPWEIDRWLDQVTSDLRNMQRMWEEGRFDYNLDHSCAEYGGCTFLQVCKSPDPKSWLSTYFQPRVWDPLARREMTIEEYETSWGHKSES